jgi:hypothetical protein
MTDETELQSDHEEMREAVRAALHLHSEASLVEPVRSGASNDTPEQSEALDMAEQVTAQLAETELHRKAAISDESEPSFGPPTSWSAESKAEWERLPPHVQAAIAKREDEVARGFDEYRNRSQQTGELEAILAPRRESYQRHGFTSDAQALNHLFTLNDAFERAPAATIVRIAQALPPDQQQQLRQAFGQQFTPGQFQTAVQQQAQELAQTWLAQHQLREFERNAPSDYPEVKPVMAAIIQNGLAGDLRSAYEIATRPTSRAAEHAARVDRKLKAASASLNGHPHGLSSETPSSRRTGKGSFGDVADDVRAAMSALS